MSNDKKAILMAKSLQQAKENALDAEGLLYNPDIVTKGKISKLSFYKEKSYLKLLHFSQNDVFKNDKY